MKRIFSFILTLSVFIASVYGELRYIEIDSIKNVPMIEIKNIDDFEAIINEYGVRIGYLQKTIDSSGRNNKKNMEGLMLYIIVDSVYFSFPMKGYLTLTDYKNGNINHFENGTDYNKAIALGFDSSDMYYYYKRNSFLNIEDCKEAYKNGFINVQYQNNSGYRPDDSVVFYDAKKIGYSNYADYQDYLDYTNNGFKNKTDWQIAKTKGFAKGKDYYTATENGFYDYKSYDIACGVGLTSNVEYQQYNRIVSDIEKIIKERNLEKNYAVIYYYIQNLPKGEMALSALSTALIKSYKAQPENISKALDFWYSEIKKDEKRRLDDYSSFTTGSTKRVTSVITCFSQEMLSTFFESKDFNELGTYNSKSQIFRRK